VDPENCAPLADEKLMKIDTYHNLKNPVISRWQPWKINLNLLNNYLFDQFLKIIQTYGFAIDITMRKQLLHEFIAIFQNLIYIFCEQYHKNAFQAVQKRSIKLLRENILQPLFIEDSFKENKKSIWDNFTILLKDYDKNFDSINKWSSPEDTALIQALIDGKKFVDLNFKGKTGYAIFKRYNSLSTQYGKDVNNILVECKKLEHIVIDEMAFNNDHTSKLGQPWSEEEHIFLQKLYNAASHDGINKINKKKFCQESVIKMGLKGRTWTSIEFKLRELIKNYWNFPMESTRPQLHNTLAFDGKTWTDVDIKRLLQLRYDEGKSIKDIAASLGRKNAATIQQLKRLPKPEKITNRKNSKWSQTDVEKMKK
jgi:hypothetical protein